MNTLSDFLGNFVVLVTALTSVRALQAADELTFNWRRQDWRSSGSLAPWHCATCGQTGYGSDGEGPRSCKRALTAGRL